MQDLNLTPEEMAVFFEEAQEQLDTMEQTLLALEDQPEAPDMVAELFRAAHTLKGGCATVGYDTMAQLTHAIESVLAQVRQGTQPLTRSLIDDFLSGVDLLRSGLTAAVTGQESPAEQIAVLTRDLTAMAAEPGPGALPRSVSDPGPRSPADSKEGIDHPGSMVRWVVTVDPAAPMASVRAYQALLVFQDAGEVLQVDPPAEHLEDDAADIHHLVVVLDMGDPPETVRERLHAIPDVVTATYEPMTTMGTIGEGFVPAPKDAEVAADPKTVAVAGVASGPDGSVIQGGPERSVRVGVQILDRLMNLVGELVVDRTRLAMLGRSELDERQLREELSQLSGHLGRITTDLQDSIMKARMIPVQTLFRKFPRLIRDLSQQLNKPITFELLGEDTELDRSVIGMLSDPLIHLLRNAVDHGLESPEQRRAAGKPAEGTVRLAAFHRENYICVEVADDGAGLQAEKIRNTVLARGLVTSEQVERLTYEQLTEMIFVPGFSTAETVSTVSGRGVGMDVVRRNLEKVNGSITVRSEPGQGTTFTIQLPLTLAIVQALLVEIRAVTFAIPLTHVTEAVLATSDDMYLAHGWRMIRLRNETVPLLDPGLVWGDASAVAWDSDGETPIVIVQSDLQPLGLMVDRLIGEEEVVVKSLGPLIGSVCGVSGASILGDGRVALIVDVPSLAREVRQNVQW